MKLKTQLFNRGVSRNLLKRFWPLWAMYFGVLLMCLPASLSSTMRYRTEDIAVSINRAVLDNGEALVVLCFAFCIIVAMAMFSYLYNQRSCGVMNALPVKRETMFITVYLTGLVPMLIADALTAGITALIFGEYLAASSLWMWLAMAVLCKLCFYGIAVFCAMLTGNILVLPCLYVVLNFGAYLAESAVDAVLRILVYGYTHIGSAMSYLSPALQLSRRLGVEYSVSELRLVEDIKVSGFAELCVYAAAGLLLTVAALLLYRRRRMETASDAVAVDALKPIFKYCLAFGGAGMFCAALYNWFFDNLLSGRPAALLALALMLTGLFLGYFAGEMLLHKTLRVFTGRWKGFIISCCIITAITACVEYDVFGFEGCIPQPSQVERVELEIRDNVSLTEADNIADAVKLHQLIVNSKDDNEKARRSQYCGINYFMKDGRQVSRKYYVESGEEQFEDADSQLASLSELSNRPEARRQRLETQLPVTADYVKYCEISGSYPSEDGLDPESISLSHQETEEFFRDCVLPDVSDSSLGSMFLSESPEYGTHMSNVVLNMDLMDIEDTNKFDYLSFGFTMDAVRCRQWLEQRGLKFITQGEVDAAGEKYS